MHLTFQQKIELEQLRALADEFDDNATALNASTSQPFGSFNQWLVHRLNHFKIAPHNSALLANAHHLFRQFQLVLGAVALLLGMLSSSGLLSAQQNQVNIFWLLGGVLGANTVTLCLWLVLALRFRNPSSGILASALASGATWLLRKIHSNTKQRLVNIAWWQTRLHSSLRKWQLSQLAHFTWLFFLLGSITGLLMVFTAQKFDFIWESTLLDESQFHIIMHMLATPIEWLGLPTPIQSDQLNPEQLRQHWALFIVCCLMLYGLLPRALAYFFVTILLVIKQNRWQLDFSNTHYIQLKQAYNQQLTHTHILDADPNPPEQSLAHAEFSSAIPPKNAAWLGLEVNPISAWSSLLPNVTALMNDQATFNKHLNLIQQSTEPFVIFVEGTRTPDRGLQRNLSALNNERTWLAVIAQKNLDTAKQIAWLNAAKKIQWDQQHCILVSL